MRPASRVAPPLTAERLELAALRYLERFAASAARLRRVLLARVERSARDHGTDRAEGGAWVEALILRYQDSGLLNDAVYAEARAASLRRRGASSRAIRDHLAARGVEAETAAAALGRTDQDLALGSTDQDLALGRSDPDIEGAADEAAALALARRRRLGPFRPEEQRSANRSRDLASLGRAGFSYETARRIIDGES